MRALLTLMFAFLPGLAVAHPGHMAEVAGHDHIVAGIAIGIAIGVAIWGALKGRKDDEVVDEADEADGATTDDEPQEA